MALNETTTSLRIFTLCSHPQVWREPIQGKPLANLWTGMNVWIYMDMLRLIGEPDAPLTFFSKFAYNKTSTKYRSVHLGFRVLEKQFSNTMYYRSKHTLCRHFWRTNLMYRLALQHFVITATSSLTLEHPITILSPKFTPREILLVIRMAISSEAYLTHPHMFC